MNKNNIPPICDIKPKKLIIHGDERVDNYYWLNDRNNPEVIKYLNEENNYSSDKMKHTENLQKDLFDEITGRLDKEETSAPYFLGGYFYSQQYQKGFEYPIFSRKKDSLSGEEEILIDQNKLAINQPFCAIGQLSVDSKNQLLAYSVDFVSRRLYDIYFKNLKTGELLQETIKGTSGSFAWANDGKTIFYTRKDDHTSVSYTHLTLPTKA